jgi:hypothetical protein
MESYPTHYVDDPNDEPPLGFSPSSSDSPPTLLSPTNSGHSSHEDGLCVRSSPPSPPLPVDLPEEGLIGKENALCNQQQFMHKEANDNAEDVASSLRNTIGQAYRGERKEIEKGRIAPIQSNLPNSENNPRILHDHEIKDTGQPAIFNSFKHPETSIGANEDTRIKKDWIQ